MRVKPADPGAVIRDPVTKRQLPADGGDVPDTSFWRRRLDAGEVVVVRETVVVASPIAPLTTRGG